MKARIILLFAAASLDLHAQENTPSVEKAQQFIQERAISGRQKTPAYGNGNYTRTYEALITSVKIHKRCELTFWVHYRATDTRGEDTLTHRLPFQEFAQLKEYGGGRNLDLFFAGASVAEGKVPPMVELFFGSEELGQRLKKAFIFLGKECQPTSAF